MTPRKPTRAKALGVSDEQYARLLAAQGGHCALCPNGPKTRRLHVDHGRKTEAVRGLLCFRHNRVVAVVNMLTEDDIRLCRDYLTGKIEPPPEARAVLDEINGVVQGEAS